MEPMTEAVLRGADPDELSRIPVPEDFVAAHLRAEDADAFIGMDSASKDVRKSVRVGRVPMPELAPDEVLVAVMASSINYNTVWSAMFEPISTFDALKRLGRGGGWDARHDQPYHVLGSDASGVIVRTGSGVRRWKVGDRVSVSPVVADTEDPRTHNDSLLSDMWAWGYETNFGGLAHYSVVRSAQLMPKPAHLSWEEAACIPLCGGTSYRMLIGEHGARMKQGDIVLIWGATGGLGSFAVQMVKNGGGVPIGVVSSERKAEIARKLGCDVVINRQEIGIGTQPEPGPATVKLAKRLGRAIRQEVGEDPHIVFDYIGKATFGMSVIVVRRGGAVVTCGSSSGFEHNYDNRYLWMNLKRIIGSHGMNLSEATETMRLSKLGKLSPVLSAVYPLAEAGEATRLVQTNAHTGKVGVLCMAPEEGLGVTDPQLRARLGEQKLNPLRSV
ncbi:(E)-2-hexenoyl-CoA reductase carboxylase [Actinacidiphila reveromycinica]|uniref:(E)-2-hexenoyl-CoA reductase carboxylase n=1 Tax=Actinacidiphila reveromycinica TaxID=659352 RepID=G1UDU0_9ACTN|nr:crotonyl-CoA carboxylase/reductase [Streptomyces sp. SN-593]BAK64636.1 putative CoA reductase carboxylase [Streptomyces sp. SN-593]BBB01293.1 (E)-2-hexenoyl-CoA reductase carboxylase [Streptomyces sp. SN-593]